MSIGKVLREAREARGLSIAQVAARTRIRAAVIEAIEAENFDQLDAEVFIRAHIRSIASAVELDPAYAMAEYRGERYEPISEMPLSTSDVNIFSVTQREALPPKKSQTPLAVAVAIVVLVAAFIGFKLVATADAGDAEILTPPSESASASSFALEETEPSDSPTLSGVTVDIQFNSRSWVRIKNSAGEIVYEATPEAGTLLTFSDDSQLTVRLGATEAVVVLVNGVEAPSDKTGVSERTFTSDVS